MLSAELSGLEEQHHIKAPPITLGIPAPLRGARLAVRGVEGNWVVTSSSFDSSLYEDRPSDLTHEKMFCSAPTGFMSHSDHWIFYRLKGLHVIMFSN